MARYRTTIRTDLAPADAFADLPLIFCSYPITPASPLLHQLARMSDLGVGGGRRREFPGTEGLRVQCW